MEYSMNSIKIFQDDNSDQIVEYKKMVKNILIILINADGSFGMSNIGAHLPDMLQRLNGMSVITTFTDNGFEIKQDPSEEVYGLYYTRNNCCKIPEEDVKRICKPGEKNCCIFLSIGSDGFECLKFDTPSARMILDRYSKGEIRASRIGNCKILGRKE